MDIKPSGMIYLIRHGQTDWNKQGIIQGRTDIPLNGYGRKQILTIAKGLNTNLAGIYSSPLKRALQTAEIVKKKTKIPIKTDEKLLEISYGLWEGKTKNRVNEIDKERYSRWLCDPTSVTPPGGESLFEVAKRVKEFIDEKRLTLSQGNTLIVSHSAPIIFICIFLQDFIMDINSNNFRRKLRSRWKDIPSPGECRKLYIN